VKAFKAHGPGHLLQDACQQLCTGLAVRSGADPAGVGSGAGPSHGPAPMELGAVRSAGLKPLTEAEREQLRKEGACFRCREPGHLAKDCPLHKGKGNAKRQ